MKKNSSVFSLTATALMSALSAIALYAATVLPTGRLALMCIAAGIMCAVVIEFGRGWGTTGAIATSIIVLLTSLDKQMSLTYIFLFSMYPVLKSFFEMPDNIIIRITLKSAYFIIVSGVFSALAYSIMALALPIVFIGACIVMMVFDFALSAFISFYMAKIHPYLRGLNKRRR